MYELCFFKKKLFIYGGDWVFIVVHGLSLGAEYQLYEVFSSQN